MVGGTIWDLQETREDKSSRNCSVLENFFLKKTGGYLYDGASHDGIFSEFLTVWEY